MITKTQIRKSLENLPENISVEEVIERLIYLEKIQKGLDDSNKGNTNTREDARRKLNRWIK